MTGPDVTLRSSLEDRLLSTRDGDGDSMDLKSMVDHGRRLVAVLGGESVPTFEFVCSPPLPDSFGVIRLDNVATGGDGVPMFLEVSIYFILLRKTAGGAISVYIPRAQIG